MTPISNIHPCVSIHAETEQIETTRSGLFGGPRDDFRTFVPGLTELWFTVNDDQTKHPLTPEQAEELGKLVSSNDSQRRTQSWIDAYLTSVR
jgi:hypothetical protein